MTRTIVRASPSGFPGENKTNLKANMSDKQTKLTRRAVLDTAWKTMTTAGVGAVVAGLGAQKARAAASNGRAVVCVYLFGGNDANNMIVPLSQYAPYAAARGGLA